MHRRSALLLTAATAVATTALLGAPAALAHIEPDPPAIEAGKQATVGFGVEHGCDGSNTNTVAIQVPSSITDAVPVQKTGWTATAAGQTITFSGGDLDAHTADSFEISFTAPAAAGTVAFPIVQTCAVGELAWIEIAADGQPEPERPAPAIEVTAGPPTSADLAPAHDDGEASADATATTAAAGSEATTAASTDAVIDTATTQAASTDGDDDSNTGTIVVIAIIAVVVIGGATAVALRRRSSSTPS